MAMGGHIIGSGFSPDERKSGWWATDSRRSVSGHLVDVLLEKQGKKDRADLSDVEAVQMGLIMQPVIGRIFEDTVGVKVRDLDTVGTYHKELWLKAHTDFMCDDGALLEVKNFNAAVANKYPEGPDDWQRLPEADLIQCIHEATVFDVNHIYFAVLFGGQQFRWWHIPVTAEMKDEFVQRAAKWWAMAQTGEMPLAETADQGRAIYTKVTDDVIVANSSAEQYAQALKAIKAKIKDLEQQEDVATAYLQNYMQEKSELLSPTGETLVTWKAAKGSKKFDATAFKSSMPQVYDQFVRETAGSRRFLLK